MTRQQWIAESAERTRAQALGRPVRVCPNCGAHGAQHFQSERIVDDRIVSAGYVCGARSVAPSQLGAEVEELHLERDDRADESLIDDLEGNRVVGVGSLVVDELLNERSGCTGVGRKAVERVAEGVGGCSHARTVAERRPRLLDLYCCAGGASAGYERAGFEVFGVDKDAQPDYPFAFHQGDALDVMRRLLAGEALAFTRRDGSVELLRLSDFDAIAGSPPCQFFTAYRRKGHGVGDGYLNLIPETREALITSGLPYIIENVAGAPLLDPVQLCGSSFGLDVRRHRLFESNVPLLALPCDHSWQTPRFAPATNRTNLRRTVEVGVWRIPLDVQQRAMGIDWMPLRQLSEAIPPAYTEHLGLQLLEHVRRAA